MSDSVGMFGIVMSKCLEIPSYPCELCDSLSGKRRKDNIAICDKCNEKYPIKENKWVEQ